MLVSLRNCYLLSLFYVNQFFLFIVLQCLYCCLTHLQINLPFVTCPQLPTPRLVLNSAICGWESNVLSNTFDFNKICCCCCCCPLPEPGLVQHTENTRFIPLKGVRLLRYQIQHNDSSKSKQVYLSLFLIFYQLAQCKGM